MKKLKLATVLSVIALGTAGIGVMQVNASATQEFTMDQISVSMWKGASVRIPDTTYTKGGLRYTMEMSIEDYETLMENVGANKTYQNVEFGVFVAPEYYNDKKSIANETNLTSAYGWLTEEEKQAETRYEDSVAGQKGLVQIINTQSVTLTDATNEDKEDVKVFYGSVVDMWQDNMLEEYIGVGYIRYTDANGTYYKFATANDNVRSMTYVAQLAIEDNKDADGTLNATYVTPFASTATDYTVDYYFRNESGDYVKNETVKASETVSSTVGATVTPEQTAIDGYTAVEAKAESGKVYANGKSSFGLYYRAETNLFDFEKDEAVTTGFYGNVAGEEKLSVVSAPGRENDTALCMEDTGTNVTAQLQVAESIKKASLNAITKYDMLNFDIYAEAASTVSFFPYTSSNEASGLAGSLSVGKWRTYSVRLADIQNGDANYLRFWNGTQGYKVYISNITLSKWDGLVSDWDKQLLNGVGLSGATAGGATVSVVADPTGSGRGHVYKWAGGSSSGSHNPNASWTNMATYVEWATAAGYDLFSIDVYKDSKCGGTVINIGSMSFAQTKTGEWETITVDLKDANSKKLMWMQNANGYVLFDNFRFAKWATVFDGETSKITLRSTHTSHPSVAIVSDPTNSNRGNVWAYSYTSSIHDQYVKVDNLANLITEAKEKGYTKLTMDVYRSTSDAVVQILGGDFKPSAKNTWQTISVDLSSLTGTNLIWLNGKGAIYFDNISFTK